MNVSAMSVIALLSTVDLCARSDAEALTSHPRLGYNLGRHLMVWRLNMLSRTLQQSLKL